MAGSSEGEWVAGSSQGLTGETASSMQSGCNSSKVLGSTRLLRPRSFISTFYPGSPLRGTEALRSINSTPRIVLICTLDAPTRPLIFSIGSNYRGGNCMERELGAPGSPWHLACLSRNRVLEGDTSGEAPGTEEEEVR